MTFAKLRHLAVAQKIDEASRIAENFEVFLAGPFVRVEEPAEHDANASTPANRLRYSLYHYLTSKGHNIYLGEDTALRETGEAHFASNNNAVVYERHYIVTHTDAVIAILASPGSFCEVGDWVSDKRICKFMLIIIDKKYENVPNYINDGVVKFARTNHAKVVYFDYEDVSGLKLVCDEFIEDIAISKRIDGLYGRT